MATDDGSAGHHGLVTDLLAAELGADPRAEVYACGPPPMLEAVRAMCERAASRPSSRSSRAWPAASAPASAASSRRGGGYVRLCVDGPVLDAADLDTA